MTSDNAIAIAEVAGLFHGMGALQFAAKLYQRAHELGTLFGAMARGTPIAGTNGAVIPPGRYWLDLVNDNTRKAWVDWTVSKPEVVIERSDWQAGDPQHVVQTVFFTIPSNATNYGMPGVIFPTQVLGFPTIATPATQTQADTVQRPPPMTYADAAKEVATTYQQAVQSGVKSVAQAAGSTAGAVTKGAFEGLGLTTPKLIGLGVIAGLLLITINRILSPLRI